MKKTFFIAMMLCCMVGVTLQAQETVGNTIFSFSGTMTQTAIAKKSSVLYIKNTIDKWKQCKTGTITTNGAGVCVYGSKYAYTEGVPEDLQKRIREANTPIVDIHITEQGKYVMILEHRGYWTNGYPEAFLKELERFRVGDLKADKIASACFNDKGDWVIVSDKHYTYSSNEIGEFLKQAVELYGTLRSVSLTGNGIIACCESGVYYKNIPSNLAKCLPHLTFKPQVIKFTDNGFFLITDGVSKYEYYL